MGSTKSRNRGGKRMNVRHSQVLMAILVLTAMAVLGPQPAWATHSVAITAGPEGTISTTDARLTFTSTEPATLACMLDGANPVPCGGPGATDGAIDYRGVSPGAHQFSVVAYSGEPDDIACAER